ncbi:MAG: hypothetical protein EBV88_08670, partial [Actinobacteria bacterium]|nr:hypothetical protein [Actinomycetota bacterium]
MRRRGEHSRRLAIGYSPRQFHDDLGEVFMSSDDTTRSSPVIPPGFSPHPWATITSASVDADGFVRVEWDDGLSFRAYGLWLAE